MDGLKSAILAIFGHALLVRPSKTHHSIWKILFVLGADEDWKAKLESAYSFLLKYSNISVIYGQQCLEKL